MIKRILLTQEVTVTHLIEIEVENEDIIEGIIDALECDRLDDLQDAILTIRNVDGVVIEGYEPEYDYDKDEFEFEIMG